MARQYEGRTALLTGSASGIGKALAEHLVKHGARVVCCDINAAAGQSAVDELNASHGSSTSPKAWFVRLNVTSWDETVEAFKQADKLVQTKLDWVFANAGADSGEMPFPRDDAAKPTTGALDVNFHGMVYTTQAAINHFRAHRGGGSIIATASLSGLYAFMDDPMYAAAKHGVVGVVRSASLRVYKEGIFINAVAPATVKTGLVPDSLMKSMEAIGLTTTKEIVIKAFEKFMTPNCRLSGQVALAMSDEKVQVLRQPSPPGWKPPRKAKL